MTEEEFVEQFAKPYKYLTGYRTIKKAYFEGLHEGKPKWHKVADGDLPPKNKPVLCYLFNESYILAFLREDNVWTTDNHNAFESVYAWCEIPQFKE